MFERMSQSGMSRREMFRFLKQIGLKTPPHGTPKGILESLSDFEKKMENLVQGDNFNLIDVVVYLDETAHRGEGKVLMPLMKAIQDYPNTFCSRYYPTLQTGSSSLRYLQIGDKVFWLEYTSNDWRSNYGEVNIQILSQEKDGFHSRIDLPLFAIDFVYGPNVFWAIDFNIAPGIRGTGIEDILSAKEVVAAIKRWFKKLNTSNLSPNGS